MVNELDRVNKNIVVGRRFPQIDGLRAVAILLVFLWHASVLSSEISPIALDSLASVHFSISILGAGGVCLFFVISAFLITGILIDTSHDSACLRKFYIRRSLRIFPLFYMAFALIGVVSVFYIKDFSFNITSLWYALYVQNWVGIVDHDFNVFNDQVHVLFNHFWSLAIEEQFYLFWPIIFLYLYRNVQGYVLVQIMLFMALASFCLRWVMVSYGGEWVLAYTWTVSRLDSLLLGALLAYAVKENGKILAVIERIRKKALTPLIFIMLVLCFSPNLYGINVKYLILMSSIVALFGVAEAVKQQGTETLSRQFLCSDWMRRIAEVSYGLYIFHWPIMKVLQFHLSESNYGYWMNYILILCLGFSLSFIISLCSYRLIEKPIINLKSKYASYNT